MTDELQSLIDMLRSRRSKDAAKAVQILREQGWLYDGSLEGIALIPTDLYRINLNRMDFQHANFRNVVIFMANAKSANLHDVSMENAYLYRVNLTSADLRNARLNNIELYDVSLANANLAGADLRGATLYSVDLRGANLSGTNLRDVDLRFCKMDSDIAQLDKLLIENARFPRLRPPRTVHDAVANKIRKEIFEGPRVINGLTSYPIQNANSIESASDVSFSSYYPRYATAMSRHRLLVYAYVKDALDKVGENALRLGRKVKSTDQRMITADETVALKVDSVLAVVPECEQLEFSPRQIKKTWNSDWINFIFNFQPSEGLTGKVAHIRISIQVEGIEIASIPDCTILITRPEPMQSEATDLSKLAETSRFHARPDNLIHTFEMALEEVRENRLAQAKKRAESYVGRIAAPYQKIFVSYSRKDAKVVKAYRAAQIAVGHDVFIDTDSIRSGEDWEARLAQEIDEADIFQLFWSENSASSPNVRDEWEYALIYKCPDTRCVTFIRPVYWSREGLKPNPPVELSHLNFRYAPFDET